MEETNKTNLMQIIQNSTPVQLFENPIVADRFRHLYMVINGIKNVDRANAFYTAEKFHLLKILNGNPKLQQCTRLSLYGVIMDVAVNGLSFDPSMKHLAIVPRSVNIGNKQNPKYEMRACLEIMGPGELLLRQLQGQVKYADNPVLVYEGDDFKYGTRDERTVVEHMASIPRKSSIIIAGYLRLTRPDGSVDYKVLTRERVEEFRKSSKDPNGAAWTNSYAGMFEAKLLKHAFKNYTKLRVGEFSKLSSETIDEEVEEISTTIDYGIDIASETETTDEGAFAESEETKPAGINHVDEDF